MHKAYGDSYIGQVVLQGGLQGQKEGGGRRGPAVGQRQLGRDLGQVGAQVDGAPHILVHQRRLATMDRPQRRQEAAQQDGDGERSPHGVERGGWRRMLPRGSQQAAAVQRNLRPHWQEARWRQPAGRGPRP